MRNEHRLLASVLLVTVFLCGCYGAASKPPDVTDTVNIGDYVFRVEEAVGDRYNVRVRYSLKRQDGSEIDSKIRFGLLHHDGLNSFGGSVQYSLSEDKKTIWIEEEQSSSQQYDSNATYTVILENLTFGESSDLAPLEGTWTASYKIQIHEDYTELLTDERKIQLPGKERSYYWLTSIQISTMGIHMEMKVPDNDIRNFAEFEAYLVMKDGTVIDLEWHHSIRGKKAPYDATGEAMFKEQIMLDKLYALTVCGQEILIADAQNP